MVSMQEDQLKMIKKKHECNLSLNGVISIYVYDSEVLNYFE